MSSPKIKKNKKEVKNNEKGVVVPIIWVEGLLEKLGEYQKSKDSKNCRFELASLEGYAQSAKYLLDHEKVNF